MASTLSVMSLLSYLKWEKMKVNWESGQLETLFVAAMIQSSHLDLARNVRLMKLGNSRV